LGWEIRQYCRRIDEHYAVRIFFHLREGESAGNPGHRMYIHQKRRFVFVEETGGLSSQLVVGCLGAVHFRGDQQGLHISCEHEWDAMLVFGCDLGYRVADG